MFIGRKATEISPMQNVVRCRIFTNVVFSVDQLFLRIIVLIILFVTTVVHDFTRATLLNENIHDHRNKSYHLCQERV